MKNREDFAQSIAELKLTHAQRAVAFLWYYRQTQEYEERTASELANDLHDDGFPKPNVTKLHKALVRCRDVVRGSRNKSFQLDVRNLSKLDEKYSDYMGIKVVKVGDSVLSRELVSGTRKYLEKLVQQINGCYEYEFFDACAVLCRRLMESLIIEVYISQGRVHDIQQDGKFLFLEKLIASITHDRKKIILGRNSYKTMNKVKEIGDTAAHDRVYITQQLDIDDIKYSYRRLINDLLSVSKIIK